MLRFLCLLPALYLLGAFGGEDTRIIFQEEFLRGQAAPEWSKHFSKGAEIEIKDGVAEIRAPLNAYAHLARPLGKDNVTVSARIRPSSPAGISWCASVFLVWSGGDWCQMGMIDAAGGGRYYAVETLHGHTVESYLRPGDLTAWHHLRIELGRNCLRYCASEDGTRWQCLRVIERPTELSGPPAWLAVGRGYGRGAPPYAGPELDNDYADRGPATVAQIADIRGEETPKERLALTPRERAQIAQADADPVGAAVLPGRADPTFESVARFYPAMKFPREVVGVPEHPDDIGIDFQGRLQFSSEAGSDKSPTARFEMGDPPNPLVVPNIPLKRRLVGGYLPIVTLSGARNGTAFEQTVFGWSEGFRPEEELFACVRLKLRIPSDANPPERVWLALSPSGQRIPVAMQPLRTREALACLRIPYNHPERAAAIAPWEFETTLAETEGIWQRLLARGMKIETPNPRVNNAYRAWLAYSLLDVDQVNGYGEPHDGAGFYEEIFGYSAALYCTALDLYGLHDRAARYLDTLLHFQQPDGLYTQNFGLPDQGTLLMALAEHYRLTGDNAWLRRAAEPMARACEWIVRQRQQAPKEGVARGLIKFRPYCDYPEPVYGYFGDACCCAGMEQAAAALDAAGRKKEARRYRQEAARYRADILRSMDAAVLRRNGRMVLPMEPETRRLLRDSGYRGGEYYGLVASCLLDSEFLPPNDRRARWITDFMEQKGGLLAGNCRFGPGGIDHAYTGGYLLTQLKRGDARRYLLGFYGMLAYGMTRDTYSGVEVTTAVSGENQQTLPHLYSCTQQLRMLRKLLLREEGDSLLIGEAIPRAWLADGKHIAVRDAPTRFGNVSFAIRSHAKAGRIEVRLNPPTRIVPRRICIRLRQSEGRPIRGVLVNGRRWTRFAGEVVTLDGVRKPIRLQALYR